ncbi:MAG: bifunctional oligoribonuclease/PAP phosphatase NrnA [Cellulosilyticaceae bacterium]
MKLKRIIDSIEASKHILMGGHISPDGDAIGSLIGMVGICRFFHIPYTIIIEEIPSKYNYLVQNINIQSNFDGEYDTFIALDCGDVERLGIYQEYFNKAKLTINIDHHHTNTGFGKLNYVQKDGSSTSELVFNLIQRAKVPLTEEIAKAIYTGLVFDTGGFMHPCTKSSTHLAAAKLLELPIDYSLIYHHIIHARTLKTIRMQGVLAQNMVFLSNGEIIMSYVTKEQMEQYGASKEDIDGVVNYVKNIEGVCVAAFIYPVNDNTYKLSLRSIAPYDVAAICKEFGGGGHIRAAGVTLTGELTEVLEKIQASLMTL